MFGRMKVNLKDTTIHKKYLNIKITLKTRNVMKEVIGKTNKSWSHLTTKLVINQIDVKSEIGTLFYKHWSRVRQENPNGIKNI